MISRLLGAIWRRVPARFRRLGVRVMHPTFTVTAGAMIFNDEGQVLLLKHRFRPGTGWGLPGGFLQVGEQPVEGLRRELREEIRLDVENVEILGARSFTRPPQIEILFRARANGKVQPQSMEVERAGWFSATSLPSGLPADQRRLVEHAVADGANRQD